MKILKRSFLTVLAVFLITVLFFVPKDIFLNMKSEVLDNSMKEALYTFSVSKGLNGVISVVQNSYMDLTPGGMGVEFAAGEILDPINDLVERFSLVMLYSVAAIGILKILNYVDLYISLKILLPVSLVLFLLGLWFKEFFLKYALKVAVLSLSLSLLVPSYIFLNHTLYNSFLKERYQSSLEKLEKNVKDIKTINVEKVEKKRDLLSYITNTVTKFDLQKRIDTLQKKLKNISNYIITILTIFIFQVLILPLFVLWLFWNITKVVLNL